MLGTATWQGWTWWNQVTAPLISEPASGANNPREPVVTIQIASGTSARQIGQDLQAAGVIRSAFAWELWSRWLLLRNPQQGFQAGTYRVSPNQPLQSIAEKIWAGDVVQHSFTIPEGWSIRQMAAYFESQGYFSAQDFLVAVRQIPNDRYPWLPTNLPHLEGFLYPDTYQLAGTSTTPQAIIRQMLDRFEQVALPLYSQRQANGQMTLLQWVTLASIVEKEAVIPAERPRIAGVFTNRLRQNMPLGADPTVEYGLGVQQTPDQPLTLDQVRTPSPYNTYLNPGLPPTPIASPGLASLQATLTPENTDYLYFVARYDGTHVFSRTLADHEAAQALIRSQQDARRNSRS